MGLSGREEIEHKRNTHNDAQNFPILIRTLHILKTNDKNDKKLKPPG